MKTLTERTEIATAINFNKYPVIKIDLTDRDEYGIKGTKVRIDNGTFRSGEPYYIRATIRTYNDEKVLTTSAGGSSLVDKMSFEDYMEMTDYANTPIIKANQEILIFLYNSTNKDIYNPIILKTGERIYPNCITPLEIEKLTLDF